MRRRDIDRLQALRDHQTACGRRWESEFVVASADLDLLRLLDTRRVEETETEMLQLAECLQDSLMNQDEADTASRRATARFAEMAEERTKREMQRNRALTELSAAQQEVAQRKSALDVACEQKKTLDHELHEVRHALVWLSASLRTSTNARDALRAQVTELQNDERRNSSLRNAAQRIGTRRNEQLQRQAFLAFRVCLSTARELTSFSCRQAVQALTVLFHRWCRAFAISRLGLTKTSLDVLRVSVRAWHLWTFSVQSLEKWSQALQTLHNRCVVRLAMMLWVQVKPRRRNYRAENFQVNLLQQWHAAAIISVCLRRKATQNVRKRLWHIMFRAFVAWYDVRQRRIKCCCASVRSSRARRLQHTSLQWWFNWSSPKALARALFREVLVHWLKRLWSVWKQHWSRALSARAVAQWSAERRVQRGLLTLRCMAVSRKVRVFSCQQEALLTRAVVDVWKGALESRWLCASARRAVVRRCLHTRICHWSHCSSQAGKRRRRHVLLHGWACQAALSLRQVVYAWEGLLLSARAARRRVTTISNRRNLIICHDALVAWLRARWLVAQEASLLRQQLGHECTSHEVGRPSEMRLTLERCDDTVV